MKTKSKSEAYKNMFTNQVLPPRVSIPATDLTVNHKGGNNSPAKTPPFRADGPAAVPASVPLNQQTHPVVSAKTDTSMQPTKTVIKETPKTPRSSAQGESALVKYTVSLPPELNDAIQSYSISNYLKSYSVVVQQAIDALSKKAQTLSSEFIEGNLVRPKSSSKLVHFYVTKEHRKIIKLIALQYKVNEYQVFRFAIELFLGRIMA